MRGNCQAEKKTPEMNKPVLYVLRVIQVLFNPLTGPRVFGVIPLSILRVLRFDYLIYRSYFLFIWLLWRTWNKIIKTSALVFYSKYGYWNTYCWMSVRPKISLVWGSEAQNSTTRRWISHAFCLNSVVTLRSSDWASVSTIRNGNSSLCGIIYFFLHNSK